MTAARPSCTPGHRLDAIRRWWDRHGSPVLTLAILCLGAYAILKLGTEFGRLLLSTGPGPMDLNWFHVMVRRWAAGGDVYVLDIPGPPAAYPPATFPMLYPFLGWLSLRAASWVWAVLNAAALAWLSVTFGRASGATSRRERWFVGLWPLAANATGVSIGNGQTTLFLLPLLVAVALRLRARSTWGRDCCTALCFVLSLSKPNVAAPFFWLVVFVAPTLRPAIMVVVGYAMLTAVGVAIQPSGLIAILTQAAANGQWVAGRNGYLDMALVLHHLGLGGLSLSMSAAVLAALGVWVRRYRDRDIWILLGVTALVARLWTYHSAYDDVLVLLSMVALMRVAMAEEGDIGTVAALLVALDVATMLALTSWVTTRTPMFWVSVAAHAIAWTASLVFLIGYAPRDRPGGRPTPAACGTPLLLE